MAELIGGLDPERVRANLDGVRERIAAAARRAGREPGDVELVAAVKYVPVDELGALARAGVRVAGENRAQDLEAKVAAHGDAFAWEFIGHLQSRKVRAVAPLVRRIHSVASDSVLRRLHDHARDDLEILIEVNVADDPAKSGIPPGDLGAFLRRCPFAPTGLMTMPPLAKDPRDSRPHFARLRELAAEHGLRHLSMGTTQDFEVAVEEGATIVRIGTSLYR